MLERGFENLLQSHVAGEALSNGVTSLCSPRIELLEVVYENKYRRIHRVKAEFGQFTKEYFVSDTSQRAGILVVKNESVLLVRQYRLLINSLSWEIPGGKVDEGEQPENAAVRECLEETGVRCLDPQPLIFYHVGLDTAFNPTHLFYCNEVSEELELKQIHAQEVSGSEWVPFYRCIEMIFSHEILDSFTMTALLAYRTIKDRVSA